MREEVSFTSKQAHLYDLQLHRQQSELRESLTNDALKFLSGINQLFATQTTSNDEDTAPRYGAYSKIDIGHSPCLHHQIYRVFLRLHHDGLLLGRLTSSSNLDFYSNHSFIRKAGIGRLGL